MNRRAGASVLLLGMVAVAQGQTLYRCGNVYSQTPCGAEAQTLNVGPKDTETPSMASKIVAEAKKQPPPPEGVVSANLQTCERRIRSAMKDPEAARISEGNRGGPTLDYADGRTFPSISYYFKVNGKNSYGAYTGEKLYSCSFDMAEKSIIYVREIGPYPIH